MKVTLIGEEILPVPPVLGGPVEQILYETALGIDGPKLSVISPYANALSGVKLCPPDTFYHVDIKKEVARVRGVLGDRMPAYMQDSMTRDYFCYLNGVTEVLHKIDPDVIEAHNRPEFVLYLLKQFPDKQIVFYMHNEPTMWPDGLVEAIPLVPGFVFVSQFLADLFVARYPESAAKVTVIHNSVDTHVWHPKVKQAAEVSRIRQTFGLGDAPTVLFLGRTVYAKGVHCLLEAMMQVRKCLPEARLMVVGSPLFAARAKDAYVAGLKQQALELGDGVVFTGYVDYLQTPYFYGAADVTVVPSLCLEGFGKVVVESMAVGVPVVGSCRGAIPEIIEDGRDGVLVDNPENAEALADGIVSVLKDQKGVLSRAARKKVEKHFAKPIRLGKVKAFYKKLEKEMRANTQ